ncbi:alpha/beta hydrolase [Streptomyces mobaraensis NBRC 13819 = DSM 40847]|uniref:alpha/beta fold hydrolase n=1 Tax=Streptomyces mobaraensis TaxID=35621 RepID=UPI000349D80F|nr:alpha/beta hydrolase [Streptomyces mobaraensis]QTT75570.1 alpha/beta hydrolase [Streptomyces mobaraensis NBRC 13819 = DSM 40847]
MSRPPFLTLPPGARAYRLATARGEFAVHDARPAGTHRGTVLLVPGFTGSKEDFIALLEPLAEGGLRAVAVDGRGQFESPGPDDASAYGREELALDVLAQAAALGDGPVHLLGHSLGGLIVRAAALRDPRPFRSLTLMSSGRGPVSAGQQERTRLLIHALEGLGMSMEEVWREMRRLDAEQGGDPEESILPTEHGAFLHRRWLATHPVQLTTTARQLMEEPDRVAELARLPLPLCVVSGAEDYAWPVPELDAMAEELSARRVRIAGAGHSPNAEEPGATAARLLEFWSSLSPTSASATAPSAVSSPEPPR